MDKKNSNNHSNNKLKSVEVMINGEKSEENIIPRNAGKMKIDVLIY